MKFVRYQHREHTSMGEVDGDQIWPVHGELMSLQRVPGAAALPCESVRLLSPVQPSKIIAVGPNYFAHLKGAAPPSRPYLWIKPASTLNHPEGAIELPLQPLPVNHESELAVIIGRTAKGVPRKDALSYILGYTCINDCTVGEMHDPSIFRASPEFVDGKIFDGFAPLGPVIETQLDVQDLRVRCRINGQTRQDHRTSDFIFSPAQLIEIISSVLTLFPGDVIATGSPPGVGPMKPGDVVEVEVEGIGILRNPCIAARH